MNMHNGMSMRIEPRATTTCLRDLIAIGERPGTGIERRQAAEIRVAAFKNEIRCLPKTNLRGVESLGELRGRLQDLIGTELNRPHSNQVLQVLDRAYELLSTA